MPLREVGLEEGMRLIKERGRITNPEIAAYCEVTPQTVSLWSRGKTFPTRQRSAERLRYLAARAGIQIRGL